MGIDPIGKEGASVPTSVGSPSPALEAQRPFDLSEAARVESAGAADAPPTSLDQLRAGRITLEGYLALKVDEATVHLGSLPSPEREMIRSVLLERIASDPMLVDLVREATGAVPRPPHDD
ncbi:MAG: hypothetical protein ABSF69_01285 [Polyangiaceae bacterium]|jgi:hypothetical protein